MKQPGGLPPVPPRWAEIIEDAQATAAEVREEGISVTLLHPGQVVPIADDRAFDVLLPGNEFEEVQSKVDSFEPTEVSIFTADEGGFRYAVVLALDESSASAICCPLYYRPGDCAELAAAAREAGSVRLRLRPLSASVNVVVSIDEPGLFFDD